MGLVLGILGPISWRLAYERRIILGRIGEHLRILTAEKAERISEEEAPGGRQQQSHPPSKTATPIDCSAICTSASGG